MAIANKTVIRETIETIEGYTLHLVPSEARTLAVILAFVGGPFAGPRADAAAIADALLDEGIDYRDTPEYELVKRRPEGLSGVFFKNQGEVQV